MIDLTLSEVTAPSSVIKEINNFICFMRVFNHVTALCYKWGRMEVVRVMGEFKRNFKMLHQVLSVARGGREKVGEQSEREREENE